jgi:hypothetical protein
MAHFAKIDADNKVVAVVVVADSTATDEQAGVNFLNNLYGTSDNWKQTSYNTDGGVHKLGGTPFRKNYAGIGDTYDADRDAFIPKKLFPSWVINDTTCQWEAPVANPNDGKNYRWNEDTTSWDEISL